MEDGGAREEPVRECVMDGHESDFIAHFAVLVAIERALGLRGCRCVDLDPMEKIAHFRTAFVASGQAPGATNTSRCLARSPTSLGRRSGLGVLASLNIKKEVLTYSPASARSPPPKKDGSRSSERFL
jgi:hypothetical protein